MSKSAQLNLFGWDRVPKKFHLFQTLREMGCQFSNFDIFHRREYDQWPLSIKKQEGTEESKYIISDIDLEAIKSGDYKKEGRNLNEYWIRFKYSGNQDLLTLLQRLVTLIAAPNASSRFPSELTTRPSMYKSQHTLPSTTTRDERSIPAPAARRKRILRREKFVV